jgi:hypothetical protein
MRIEGGKKLRAQLSRLPEAIRADVAKAVRRQTEKGVRTARILAPEDSGQTRRLIRAAYYDRGMIGEIVAIDSDAPRTEKDRQYSIEHGRQRGAHGRTTGAKYMATTRRYLAKTWANALRRAVRKAAKRAAGHG